jgi:hypothetical protein
MKKIMTTISIIVMATLLSSCGENSGGNNPASISPTVESITQALDTKKIETIKIFKGETLFFPIDLSNNYYVTPAPEADDPQIFRVEISQGMNGVLITGLNPGSQQFILSQGNKIISINIEIDTPDFHNPSDNDSGIIIDENGNESPGLFFDFIKQDNPNKLFVVNLN